MRDYLNQIKIKGFEDLLSVDQLSKQISKDKEAPTIYKLENYSFPIVSGLVSNRELFATALGIKKNQIINYISEKLDRLNNFTEVDEAEFLANNTNVTKNTDLENSYSKTKFKFQRCIS